MSLPVKGEGAAQVRLRHGVAIGPADNERWQVRWDFDEVLFLSGESCRVVLPWLAPRLSRQSSLLDLEREAQRRSVEAAFREVIDCLRAHRFLDETPGGEMMSPVAELADAIHALGGDSKMVRERLSRFPVLVVGRSRVAGRVVELARAQGFDSVELRSPDSDLSAQSFLVAIDPDCSGAQLDEINSRRIAGQRPWMLVGAWNRRILVGPIFIPGETACYGCYRARLASHRAHLDAFRALNTWRRTREETRGCEPLLPALAELTAAHVTAELFHFVAGLQPARTVGRVLVYQPADVALAIESVLRVPWCPACEAFGSPTGIDQSASVTSRRVELDE